MASFFVQSAMPLSGTAWTGTAPGDPGTQVPSGTITSTTDWSTWGTKISFGPKFDEVEFTNFGSGGTKQFKPGLLSADVSIEVNQDYAASQVDATVWPLFIARTLVYFDLKPTSSARSATNPSVIFAGYFTSYPIEFGVGDAATVSFDFTVTGLPARVTS